MRKVKRILLADDDAGIVDSTTMLLEMMGYNVDSTLDGSIVPQVVTSTSSPDLVIMDIWMAGIDGRDICRIIKNDPVTSKIPVLMISASKDIKASAMESGADAFLEKPFELQELIDTIEKLAN